MLQIIFLHVFAYGQLSEGSMQAGTLDSLAVNIMWAFCRPPVDVFMMISGYFLVTSSFNIKKTLKRGGTVYGAMIFYSLIISAVVFIIDPSKINVNSCVSAFTPFLSKTWYFLSDYLIVLLLSPFINKMLVSITKKQYLYLLGIVIGVMSVWSTLAGIDGIKNVISIDKIVDEFYGKSLGGFLMFYMIGGYLRLHIKKKEGKTKPNLLYLAVYLGLCLLDLGIRGLFVEYEPVFGMFNNPIVLAEGVVLILLFRDMTFSSKAINTIAGTTLGIYAIHENPYVRDWIWSVFNFSDIHLYDSLIYIPLAILAVAAVFIACSLLELLRLKLFKLVGDIAAKRKNKNLSQ